jgi:uncharacterized membrane protein
VVAYVLGNVPVIVIVKVPVNEAVVTEIVPVEGATEKNGDKAVESLFKAV